MDFENILLEKDGGVATLTLNRPDRLNSCTTGTYRELSMIMRQINRDDEIKVVILTGAGRGFCAGSDISDRLASRIEKGGEENRFEILQQVGSTALDVADVDKPIIAAINGVAVGAGLSLTLLCDFRIASEKARFGAVWVNMGLIPDVGATYYLPRIVGVEKAMELMVTGDIINADEALRIGLVSKVVSSDQLMITAKDLATKIAAGPSVAIELMKRGLRRALNNDLKTQLDYESYAQNTCRKTEDHKEAIQAFMGKRKPQFKGM
jgi:2-(1,2-epoxy-1,2-dihydrophenyl)acetyl-CoA isomerase